MHVSVHSASNVLKSSTNFGICSGSFAFIIITFPQLLFSKGLPVPSFQYALKSSLQIVGRIASNMSLDHPNWTFLSAPIATLCLNSYSLPQQLLSASPATLCLNSYSLPQQLLFASTATLCLNSYSLPQQPLSASTATLCLNNPSLPQQPLSVS